MALKEKLNEGKKADPRPDEEKIKIHHFPGTGYLVIKHRRPDQQRGRPDKVSAADLMVLAETRFRTIAALLVCIEAGQLADIVHDIPVQHERWIFVKDSACRKADTVSSFGDHGRISRNPSSQALS
ncbi:hypothetical protein [Faecalibaculum rodentium]|uniref:hypothetical protein n=1 Tax=Faecalibaculum rodentium TaxID=1702221 RepID=UPI0023F28917|nr:hypothetical protein [Faecalibaculum rodentium]